MLMLLHGENVAASRAELDRVKATASTKEIRIVEGKSIESAALTQALQSTSLFGGDTLVIIEQLFGSILKKTTLVKERAQILANKSPEIDVVLWEEKEIGKSAINELDAHCKIMLFDLPKTLFQFLDGIGPQHTKSILSLYEQTISTEAPELIHNLLVKRIRHLLMICDGVNPPGMSAWQLGRLTKQAKLFTITRLLSMYHNLTVIEHAVKSGATPFRLSQLTQQLLLTV